MLYHLAPLFSKLVEMAKLFIVALCLLSCLAGVALAMETFTIQGRVYCDTCRAGFETSATEYLQGMSQLA